MTGRALQMQNVQLTLDEVSILEEAMEALIAEQLAVVSMDQTDGVMALDHINELAAMRQLRSVLTKVLTEG